MLYSVFVGCLKSHICFRVVPKANSRIYRRLSHQKEVRVFKIRLTREVGLRNLKENET